MRGQSSTPQSSVPQPSVPQSSVVSPYSNPAFVLARPLQHDFYIPLAFEPGKLFAPLDQKDAIARSQIVDRQRIQFALRIDAIQVDVIKIRARPAIFMD